MLRNNADVRRCSYFDLGLPVVSLQFIPLIEATKKPLTLTEGRLGLTHRRPNFPLTGTHHSPRSASVWRLTTCSNLLQSTGMPIPCIPEWLLMGKTAALHWIVKRGSCRLVLRPPCSSKLNMLSKLFICQDHIQDYCLLSHVFCFYTSGNYSKHLY